MSTGWSITYPKARKAHWCEMCRRRIDPGETYMRGVGFDGTAWTWKECTHCEAVRRMYDISDGGEYNESMYDSWATDPRTVTELRHAVGYQKQWRNKRGELWPIPGADAIRHTATPEGGK